MKTVTTTAAPENTRAIIECGKALVVIDHYLDRCEIIALPNNNEAHTLAEFLPLGLIDADVHVFHKTDRRWSQEPAEASETEDNAPAPFGGVRYEDDNHAASIQIGKWQYLVVDCGPDITGGSCLAAVYNKTTRRGKPDVYGDHHLAVSKKRGRIVTGIFS